MILNVGAVFASDNVSESLDSNNLFLDEVNDSVDINVTDNELSNTNKTNSSINIVSDSVIYYNDDFKVNLTDSQTGIGISNENITFTIDNQSFIKTTDEFGFCSINMNFLFGNYSVSYEFLGNELYESCNGSTNVSVVKSPTFLDNASIVVYSGNKFCVYLKDSNGNPVSNQTIFFSLNNREYKRITNNEGFVGLNINLIPNNYTIGYGFKGNGFYENCSCSNNFSVLKSLTTINNVSDMVYCGGKFCVCLKDGNGTPLTNQAVKFTVNNKVYSRLTDNDGIAKLNINLNPKNYNISYCFEGNLRYCTSYDLTNLSVCRKNTVLEVNNSVMNYKKGNKFNVLLKDENNTVLANQQVAITINGVTYSRTTNQYGIAKLNINLGIGNYSVSCKFNENKYYSSSNGECYLLINGTQIYTQDKVISYGMGQSFEATLKDYNQGCLANKTVVFNINNVNYQRVTNSMGVAKLKINLAPGTYGITCTYNCDNNKGNGYGYGKNNSSISVSNVISVVINSQRLGENYRGYVDLVGVIGNPESENKIAYVIGLHTLESQTHDALYNSLISDCSNLNYCYYIYKITVTDNPYDYDVGRMNGQLLAQEFIVPHVLANNYDLVVDVHSNTGYSTHYFLYGALNEDKSVNVAYQVINEIPGFVYYFPESQTSPPYLINQIVNGGTKAICFETWGYESIGTTYNCVNHLIASVDHAFVKF